MFLTKYQLLEFRPEFLKNSADVCFSDKILTVEYTKENCYIGDIGGFKQLFSQNFVGEVDDCGILRRLLSEYI